VRSSARIEVARRGGRDVLVDVRSEPPVAIRRTPGRVLLVSSAAAPVAGDELHLDLDVGPGAHLAVGTAAATIVWPPPSECWRPPECSRAPRGRRQHSEQVVSARVGSGGALVWRPEPTISVTGSDHRVRFDVSLDGAASAVIVEEVVLGRTGEPSGSLELATRVVRDGTVVVDHAERLGPTTPGWGSVGLVGAARHLVAAVVVGGPAGGSSVVVEPDVAAAWLPTAVDAGVLLAVGPDRLATLEVARRVAPPPLLATRGPVGPDLRMV
jgi:urease accessory protein